VRKGFTLVELLMAIGIMLIVGSISAGLFMALMRDIPARKRAVDEHTALAGMVRRMRKDFQAASAVAMPAGTSDIVLTAPGGKVRYRAAAGAVQRTEKPVDNAGKARTMSWPAPHATVRWSLRRAGGKVVGVEVRTRVNPPDWVRDQRPLTNAHVLLLGPAGKAGRTP